MISTIISIEGTDYQIRFENRQLQEIRHKAPERFGLGKVKFASPMNILDYIGDIDVQIYLFQKGLEWKGSGIEKIDFEKAADLRQAYLEQGEPDEGQKYDAFIELLIDAISLNVVGASGKKLQAIGRKKKEEEMEKRAANQVEEIARMNEGRLIGQARAAAKLKAEGLELPGTPGTGTPPKPQ